jgi:Domain of unknown function (DUF6484)
MNDVMTENTCDNLLDDAVEESAFRTDDRLRGRSEPTPITGARIGALIALDAGGAPLVVFPGQLGSAAIAAKATLDLHGSHIGRDVVLMFEEGDPRAPIIVGCLNSADGLLAPDLAGKVEVDCDGQRLSITAKNQLVLRCGKAHITLTKEGKVIIQGTYVSTRSSGVNKIKGGSVQIN